MPGLSCNRDPSARDRRDRRTRTRGRGRTRRPIGESRCWSRSWARDVRSLCKRGPRRSQRKEQSMDWMNLRCRSPMIQFPAPRCPDRKAWSRCLRVEASRATARSRSLGPSSRRNSEVSMNLSLPRSKSIPNRTSWKWRWRNHQPPELTCLERPLPLRWSPLHGDRDARPSCLEPNPDRSRRIRHLGHRGETSTGSTRPESPNRRSELDSPATGRGHSPEPQPGSEPRSNRGRPTVSPRLPGTPFRRYRFPLKDRPSLEEARHQTRSAIRGQEATYHGFPDPRR